MTNTHIAESGENVNALQTGSPQPGIGHNGMTRQEWLRVVLHSREVTRISQHLALVVYHLTDPATNVAKMSLRELESVTGWGRQTILDHLSELDIFIRVTIGRGRAKTQFEIQALSDAVAAVSDARQTSIVSATSTATPDAMLDKSVESGKTTTTLDTKPDTTNVVRLADAKSSVESGSRTQGVKEGGIIGGESRKTLTFHNDPTSLSVDAHASADAPTWGFETDGGFMGQAFEISADAYAAMQRFYGELAFPAELVAADAYLAPKFEEDGTKDISKRLGRLHQYLAAQNRKALSERRAAEAAFASKADLGRDDSCHFDGDKLVVANGFRAELLTELQLTDQRLKTLLIKVSGKVPPNLRGADLRRLVRAEVLKQRDWDDRDERKVSAIEKRGAPVAYKPKPAPTRQTFSDPADDPAMLEWIKANGLVNEVPQ